MHPHCYRPLVSLQCKYEKLAQTSYLCLVFASCTSIVLIALPHPYGILLVVVCILPHGTYMFLISPQWKHVSNTHSSSIRTLIYLRT